MAQGQNGTALAEQQPEGELNSGARERVTAVESKECAEEEEEEELFERKKRLVNREKKTTKNMSVYEKAAYFFNLTGFSEASEN